MNEGEGRTVTLKLQHWSHASPAQVAELRTSASKLAQFLASSHVPRVGLGMYWHAVPYLIEGIPANLDEPYRWFIEGGETIGSNEAGDVRYLSPTQVGRLARALEEEEPDELGYGGWDEAKMDRLEIYPRRWVRIGGKSDHLGTLRELYSYVRDHVAAVKKSKAGLVIHLTHETLTDDDDNDEDAIAGAPSPSPQAPASAPLGNVVFSALVSASSAFVLEVKKRRFFADFLQNQDPAALHAALVTRRAKLAKKHGKPLAVERTLEACVAVWEGYLARMQTEAV